MNKFKVVVTLVAVGCFAGALTTSAQWVIDTVDDQNLITFETDVTNVFVANSGIEGSYNICEPDAWQISTMNTNRGAGLISISAASRQQWFPYDGSGSQGTPTRFLADANGDGANTSGQIGFNQVGTKLGAGATGNHAYQLSQQNDSAFNGLCFRIKNNTGETIYNWKFEADIYFGETNSAPENFSVLGYSYAVNDGTDPSTNYMSFTSFGTAPAVKSGDVITKLAGTLDETVNTAGVKNGGFIVLRFEDASTSGSDVYIDNIGVAAIKLPPRGQTRKNH